MECYDKTGHIYNIKQYIFKQLGNTWSSIIVTYSYEVGGGHHDYLVHTTPQTAYNYEVGVNQTGYVESMKSNTYWSTELGDYDSATSNNWLYLSSSEWTISRVTNISNNAFYIDMLGRIRSDASFTNFTYRIRPCFYLNSNVAYIAGDGSQQNPIRIA